MAVKRRTSKTVKAKRRTHDALKPVNLSVCPNCGAKILPHHMCKECGQYDGKQIVAKD